MYKIGNIEFSNKKEISFHISNLIKNYENKEKIECIEDLEFINELIKYHPNYETKVKNMDYFFIGRNEYINNCLFIKYKNGMNDDISLTKCVSYIPFDKYGMKDFIFPFGKYKGISIYEIDDRQYIEWLVGDNFLDRGTKTQLNQFLRFGFIPFNPVAAKKVKEKKQ